MNKKIVKKIASIFMLLAIMSTTLANPIMNIGHVMATTMNESSEPVTEVATISDTSTEVSSEAIVVESAVDDVASSSIGEEEVISDSAIVEPVSEVDANAISDEAVVDTISDDSNIVADSAVEAEVVVPKVDNSSAKSANTVEVDKSSETTSAVTSKSSANSSVSISPLAQDLCNDSNSEPPKFTSFVQQDGTNNFDVTYFGIPPAGYDATSITVNLNFGNDKSVIATNSVAEGDFEFVFDDVEHTNTLYLTPDEAIALAQNMKQHGNDPINPVKYTITFTYITDSGISCTRETDAEGFRDYVPVFPEPVITAVRTCIAGQIDVNFNPDQTKYPTGAEYKIFEDDVAITDPLSIDTDYSSLLTGRDSLSHSYYAVIDMDGFATTDLDDLNVESNVADSNVFLTPPTLGDFNVTRDGNTIIPDFSGVNFNDYPSAVATIVVDGPLADDTQSYPININEPTPIGPLAPGSYTVHLHIEYGECGPIDSDEITIVIPYPAPTLFAAPICLEEEAATLVNFTFGTAENPTGSYPSTAKILLLDSEGELVVGQMPLDITSTSITLSDPGTYSFAIDITGDGLDSEDPRSSSVSLEPEIAASIDLIKLSVLNNTIIPEYDVSYLGSNALEGSIEIMGPNGYTNIIEIDSENFVINQDKLLEAIGDLAPGNYSATLVVDYGCGTVEKMSDVVTIPQEVTQYPEPTFDVTFICDEDGEAALVEFTFGDIEDPSGPYPSDAQIILLDEEGVVGDPYAIDTDSITLIDPGNYFIGIDIDGDGMLEEGDPVSEVISFEEEIVPMINSFKLSVADNTIIPEYDVSYDGENELSGMITIDSEVLDEPIIIEISSDTFGDNLDAIANLEPGVYSAMLSVDYGGCNTVEAMSADVTIPTSTPPPVEEPPINEPPVNEPPVNEPPKLAYTGLENNFFESMILNIKEVILSAL